MVALFTDTQNELQRVAASMAGGGLSASGAALDGRPAPSPATDELIGGFSGIGIAEERGGHGGTLVDAVVFVHALARGLEPDDFACHLAATHAADALGHDVGAAVAGTLRYSTAASESATPWGSWTTAVDAERVVGRKIAVPYAAVADRLVVFGADGLGAVVADFDVAETDSLDPSLRLGEVAIDTSPVEAPAPTAEAIGRMLVLTAASLCGVGHGSLDLGASYATEREQFGRPIGQFQGVSHQLANALVDVETAWNLVLYAAWAIDAQAPDRVLVAHSAIAAAGRAATEAAERTLQVHGGIGVTWEADPHLYLRRAMVLDVLVGGNRHHARQVGRHSLTSS